MDIVLLAAFPTEFRLLVGLGVLIAGVLTAFWFFMAKNNPKSRGVDALPSNNDAHKLQDQYDKGEISEEEYQQKLRALENGQKR